jgi:tetratricopeptide (TPR) repeat protein/tRNA A-37 threonylcarbamoyl transferase component Bud32/TolB-like protein
MAKRDVPDGAPTAGLTPGGGSPVGPGPAPVAAVDELLAGRFRVVRLLGQGGMGQVYEAEDLELRERVAVKVVRPDIAHDTAAHERFRREISLARRVTHPNVCRIFDLFLHRAPGTAEPLALISMELLRGETLSERLRRQGPLTLAHARDIGRQIAAALDAAHRAGVVHRDLKPSNVVLVDDGEATRAVVTDFGLASAAGTDGEGGTEPLVRGTAAYMAPEQVEGLPSTGATDVYAFGITLYEMVTSHVPFHGSSPLSTALQRLRAAPVAPTVHRPDLDRRWETVILRCLERSPAARFASAGEAVRELEDPSSRAAPPRSRLAWATAAVLAAVLVTLPFLLVRESAPPDAPAAGSVRARPLVALLGFRNLAGRPDSAWLSAALAEMLGIELVAGEALRLASGEDVARLRASFALPEAETLAKDTLARVHRSLGADFVVLGSYVALGSESGGRLRLDVRVQDAHSGETVAVFTETGTEAGVLDLVSRAGTALRERLGAGRLTGTQQAEARASQPTTPEAARFYTEGVARLRLYDALGAREWLERAVAADAQHPLPHAALAEALARLGHDAAAAQEARRAGELARGLPRAEKLRVEGLAHETAGDLPKAIESYRVLFGFFPDDLEHGLRLARVLTNAGRAQEALTVVADLRRLPPPHGADPRLPLAEADARLSLSDFEGARQAARQAAKSAEGRDARHVQARAALVEGSALWGLGEQESAGASFALARDVFEQVGDRGGAAAAYNRMAGVPYERGDFRAAQAMFEQALAVCREIGDRRCIGRQLGNVAEARASRGELGPARAMYLEAAALNRDSRNLAPLADNLNGLGTVRFYEADLAGASRDFEEALSIARSIGDRRHVGYALHGLGRVRLMAGDSGGARKAHEEALALRRQMNQSDTVAASSLALALVDLAEGKPAEAEPLATAAAAEFAREGFADYEAEALAVRAQALAATARRAEAQEAADRAITLVRASQNPAARVRTAVFVLRALPPGSPIPTDLLALAREAIAESRRLGLRTGYLAAEIALAEVQGDAARKAPAVAEARKLGLLALAR